MKINFLKSPGFKPAGVILALGMLSALSVPASATLIGDTFDWVVSSPGFVPGSDPWDTGTNLIGAGVETDVEFTSAAGTLFGSIDFDDSTLDLSLDLDTFGAIGTVIDWVFTDLDWVGLPGSIVNVSQSGGSAVDSIMFTADSITIRTANVSNPPQQIHTWSFDIEAVHPAGPGPGPGIPEPGSLLLMGLGLAGLRLSTRRKKA